MSSIFLSGAERIFGAVEGGNPSRRRIPTPPALPSVGADVGAKFAGLEGGWIQEMMAGVMECLAGPAGRRGRRHRGWDVN